MLKALKKLFVYKEPSATDKEMGFELLEEPSESSKWDQEVLNVNKNKEVHEEGNNKKENRDDGQDEQKKQDNEQDNQDELGSKVKQDNKKEKYSQDEQDNQEEQDDKAKQDSKEEKDSEDEQNNEDEQGSEKEESQKLVQEKLLNILKESQISHEDSEDSKLKSPKTLAPNSIDKPTVQKISRKKQKKKESNKNNKKSKKDEDLKEKNKDERKGNEEKSNWDEKSEKNKNQNDNKTKEEDNDKKISSSLSENIKYLKNKFHVPKNKDAIIREFNIAHKLPACVVFIDGMVEESIIIQFTLPQLMDVNPFCGFKGGCPLDFIERNVLPVHQIERMENFKEIIEKILAGLTAIFIDGCDECIIMESRGFEKRSVGVPATETVVQGSQEGFTENIRTNITLVRRIIKSENLITEFMLVSKKNNTTAALLYIEGLTNHRIIKEVKRRIESLDVDYLSGSGMLAQLIEDKAIMPFPQLVSTERPDRVASFLMDGKVVLICEGTPFALAVPITFFDLFHTSEESNLKWQYGSFIRFVRLLGLLLAVLLPGMYTALILFHQEMIPTSLLSSIIVSRAAVPFPTIIEILLMEFSFELIREGGIRVPGVTGNTLGIIGALILGQAAVEAGLVSPILIIIVAVSGLGSFAIPNYSLSLGIRMIRFLLIGFGYVGGFYGISAGVTVLFAFALSMKSFGVPFFSPYAPVTKHNRDLVTRRPIQNQTYRPDFLDPMKEKKTGRMPQGWKVSPGKGGNKNAQ